MDAIDVALVTTDGKDSVARGPGGSYPYPPAVRDELLAVIADTNRAKSDPLADIEADRKSTRLNSSHQRISRMPSSA